MNSQEEILALAARHGLKLTNEFHVNELGLDFKVIIAKDEKGSRWALRVPRRSDVLAKMKRELKILKFLKPRLSVSIPDWKIATTELIAYPFLADYPALMIDSKTRGQTWNIDQNSPNFTKSFALTLAELHKISVDDAKLAGVRHSTPSEARQTFKNQLDQVKKEIGLKPALENQWRKWLDDDSSWPTFSVLVHGDLYVGHTLVNREDSITGIIDWSEAEISDPSIDFSAHFKVFGEAGLTDLIEGYKKAGGKTWPKMSDHIKIRQTTEPVKFAAFVLESGRKDLLPQAETMLGLR